MPGWSVFVTAAPSQDYGAQTDEHLITDINKIEMLPSTARMIPCREGISRTCSVATAGHAERSAA